MPENRTLPALRGKKGNKSKVTSRHILAAAIKGKYAWVPYSSEDFSRDKRREIALEDRA